jgi:hypothetical protein
MGVAGRRNAHLHARHSRHARRNAAGEGSRRGSRRGGQQRPAVSGTGEDAAWLLAVRRLGSPDYRATWLLWYEMV